MLNIIYPFLTRIGTLWLTGSIGPAQEHFMSNLIRQKVIVAIDGQVIKYHPNSKKFLLFLPEGELHEISLLFTSYVIRAHHHRVVYLGQTLPFNELIFAYDVHQPDYIFATITSVPAHDEVQTYVNKLCQQFPKSQVLLTGYQVIGQDIEVGANCTIINKLEDLVQLL